MHKISSDGATVGGEFTDGNAALAIPATVVEDTWLNAVQREILAVINGAGITPSTDPNTDPGNQMVAAVLQLIQNGGQAAPFSFTIPNNQASAADVTGFPQLDVTKVRSLEAFISIVRRTDSGFVKQTGRIYMTWMTAVELGLGSGAWDISISSVFDSAGVTFSLLLVSGNIWKLQYTSDNMSGSSYTGNIKITDIKYNLF